MDREPNRLEKPLTEQEAEELAKLTRQAKEGDAGAFCALYKSVYLDLYRFAFYTMKQPQDAEDAVSEAVIKAFEKIGTLKKEDAFKSWMFQILVNCCRQKLRQEGRRQLLQEEEPVCGPDPELSLSLREALGKLSGEERIIIALSVFGGYKSGEIGLQLGLPATTVRSKLSRGLGKMRDFLGEEDEK